MHQSLPAFMRWAVCLKAVSMFTKESFFLKVQDDYLCTNYQDTCINDKIMDGTLGIISCLIQEC